MPVRLLHTRFAAFRVFRPQLFALRPLCSLFLPIGSRTKGTFCARQSRPFRRETSSRLVVFSLSRLAPPIPRVCVAHVPPASRPADTNAPLAGRGHQARTKPAPSLPQAYAPPTRRGQQACAKAFPHPRAARKPQSGQMRPAGARRLPRVCAPCGARTPCTDFVRQDKRDVAPLGDTASMAAGSLPADSSAAAHGPAGSSGQLRTGASMSAWIIGHTGGNLGSML